MALNLSKTLVVGDYKSFGDPLYEGMSSFIEGLVLGNHEVRRFDLLTRRIGPCDSCGACNTNEFPCSYLDDFNSLATPLLEADSLVLFAEGDFSKAPPLPGPLLHSVEARESVVWSPILRDNLALLKLSNLTSAPAKP